MSEKKIDVSGIKPLSTGEMEDMVGGVSRQEYCNTLEATYNSSSVEKANSEWDSYKSAWDTNCAGQVA